MSHETSDRRFTHLNGARFDADRVAALYHVHQAVLQLRRLGLAEDLVDKLVDVADALAPTAVERAADQWLMDELEQPADRIGRRLTRGKLLRELFRLHRLEAELAAEADPVDA